MAEEREDRSSLFGGVEVRRRRANSVVGILKLRVPDSSGAQLKNENIGLMWRSLPVLLTIL
jgi:hypothetical protein